MTENNNDYYSRGDIVIAQNYWIDGSVQHGERPYLIVSNNMCNQYSPTLTVVPLTTKYKHWMPTHYVVKINGRRNTILAEQICCISKESITSYFCKLEDSDMKEVDDKIKVQLSL